MRTTRILSTYVLREVLLYALVGAVAFTSVIATQNVIRKLGPLLDSGLTLVDLASLMTNVLLMLASYMVPVAFLFGVLLAIGRLSADSEVIAMRACGLGLRQLITPVVLLSLPVALVTGVLTVKVESDARRSLRTLIREVASRGAFLEPHEFVGIGRRVIYVESRTRDNELEQVMISDRSDPERRFTVFANRGRFYFDDDRAALHLELYDGAIHFEPSSAGDPDYREITFERFDYPVDASDLFDEAGEIKPREMSMAELHHVMDRIEAGENLKDLREPNPRAYPMQIHRRYALAVTPILFALVGTPLGLRRTRGARSFGALVCAVMVFAYYALLSFGEYLGEIGSVPPWTAMWVPNVAFLLAAVPLIRRNLRGEI